MASPFINIKDKRFFHPTEYNDSIFSYGSATTNHLLHWVIFFPALNIKSWTKAASWPEF